METQKFLIIQTAFLGDLVLTIPLINALFKKNKGCEVHVVCQPFGVQLFQGFQNVVVHSYDKKKDRGVGSFFKLLNELRKNNFFEVVFSVHRSPRSVFLGRAVRSKRRISFRSLTAALLEYETVAYPNYQKGVHYSDRVMRLFELYEKKRSTVDLYLPVVADEDVGDQKKKFSDYVVLSPFSAWATKKWPIDKYIELAKKILSQTQCSIVWVGAAEEASENEKINTAITSERNHNLIGRTKLPELFSIIREAKVLVSNDSAPVHLASCFDVPTVAIFGPTDTKFGFFPLSSRSKVVEISQEQLSCRPCHIHGPQKCPLKHFECMNGISVDDVYQAVRGIS